MVLWLVHYTVPRGFWGFLSPLAALRLSRSFLKKNCKKNLWDQGTSSQVLIFVVILVITKEKFLRYFKSSWFSWPHCNKHELINIIINIFIIFIFLTAVTVIESKWCKRSYSISEKKHETELSWKKLPSW